MTPLGSIRVIGKNLLLVTALTISVSAQVTSVVKVLSSPNPVVQGQTETFVAGVNLAGVTAPGGAITITDTVVCPGASTATVSVLGTITLGTVTSPTPGAGTLAVSSFPCVGANSIVATYSGDSNYLPGTSQPLLVTVRAQFTPTSLTLVSSLNPSIVGQTATFSAQLTYSLSYNSYPTGTVTFKDTNTGNVLGTALVQTSGTGSEVVTIASLSTSSLIAASYAIQAIYSGDGIYAPSNSPTLIQVVQQSVIYPTNTSLAASPVQVSAGQWIALTVLVSSVGGTPAGAVSIYDGSALLVTLGLDASGQAVFTISSLTAGAHAITAAYGGASTFAASTSPVVSVNVLPPLLAPTTTTLASSVNPAFDSVSFAIAVTVSSSSPGTPTGTITLFDALLPGQMLGTVALQNGSATLNVSLPAGTHPLSVTYSGDNNFAPSTGALTEVVNPPVQSSTSTTIASSANSSVYGQTITLTAAVTGTSGIPTGTVTFSASSISVTVILDNTGAAAFTTSLPVGSFSFSAVYSGDPTNAGSTSPVLGLTVNPASPYVGIGASANPSVVGSPVTFTAFVMANPPGSGTPTGTVSFVADGSVILCANVILQAMTASCIANSLSVGPHTIAASYSGDPNFTVGSGQTTQTVTN